jgi:hypothetical protein
MVNPKFSAHQPRAINRASQADFTVGVALALQRVSPHRSQLNLNSFHPQLPDQSIQGVILC